MDALLPHLDASAVDEAWLELFHRIPAHVSKDVADRLAEAQAEHHDLRTLPPHQLRLHCFRFFPPQYTRVVLLGVEPPEELDDCVGLSFSIPGGERLPAHLKMMFRELCNDIGQVRAPRSGNLTWWAQQGVLLLNSSLTVAEGLPGSHASIWHAWTAHLLELLSTHYPGVVYMLWGEEARSYLPHIHTGADAQCPDNMIITGPYPRVANRFSFFSQRYFSRANEALELLGKSPINWLLL